MCMITLDVFDDDKLPGKLHVRVDAIDVVIPTGDHCEIWTRTGLRACVRQDSETVLRMINLKKM